MNPGRESLGFDGVVAIKCGQLSHKVIDCCIMSASSHEPVAIGKGVGEVEEGLGSIEEGGGFYRCLEGCLESISICMDIELNYTSKLLCLSE
jgi:hypothetical protein